MSDGSARPLNQDGSTAEAREAVYEWLLSELAHRSDNVVIDVRKYMPRPYEVGPESVMTMGELRRRIRLLRVPKPGPEQPPMGRRRHA